MNVGVGDIAMLVHPVYKENQDKICEVIKQIPTEDGRVVWFCQYRERIRTSAFETHGLVDISTSDDWRLMRIAGPSVEIEKVTVKYKERRRVPRLPTPQDV